MGKCVVIGAGCPHFIIMELQGIPKEIRTAELIIACAISYAYDKDGEIYKILTE